LEINTIRGERVSKTATSAEAVYQRSRLMFKKKISTKRRKKAVERENRIIEEEARGRREQLGLRS
jgi:hypothetical protein